MHMFDEIRHLVRDFPVAELVGRMGYTSNPDQHAQRLARVLDDPDMGLSRGEYDFVHGSPGFLLALCKALGMDEAVTALRLDDIIARVEARDSAYAPWLHVQSSGADEAARGLDRMGRWGLSLGRKLPLREQAAGAPLEDIITLAREEIREHIQETGGKLKAGAGIDGYLLVYRADGPALRMDPAGSVVGVQGTGLLGGA